MKDDVNQAQMAIEKLVEASDNAYFNAVTLNTFACLLYGGLDDGTRVCGETTVDNVKLSLNHLAIQAENAFGELSRALHGMDEAPLEALERAQIALSQNDVLTVKHNQVAKVA